MIGERGFNFHKIKDELYLYKDSDLPESVIPLFWYNNNLYMNIASSFPSSYVKLDSRAILSCVIKLQKKLENFEESLLNSRSIGLYKIDPILKIETPEGPQEITPLHEIKIFISKKKNYSITGHIDNNLTNRIKPRYFQTKEKLLRYFYKNYMPDTVEFILRYII